MANLIIKPTSGGSLVLQDEGGDAALTVGTTGSTTLAGTANNLGTVTAATINGATFGSAVTGTQAGTGAFAARYSSGSWVTLAADTVAAFDNDSTADSFDTDSNYDTTNYRYVCPAAGVYYFWMSIYTAYNDTSNGFHFKKNEADINLTNDSAKLFCFINNADDCTMNGSLVLTLAASDRIAVYADQASDIFTGHSSWGGCRLR